MVNTFVVSSCVIDCAKQLDYKRLGKQRVEARQIYNALIGKYEKAWVNHPATLAWVGHTNALNHYTNAMIKEWIARGYNNTMEMFPVSEPVEWPWWFYWDVLQNSHKASLNRKDPSFYSFKIPDEYTKFGYVWPSKVPEQYRNVANPPLEIVCAPIQVPVSYSKKKRKPEPEPSQPNATDSVVAPVPLNPKANGKEKGQKHGGKSEAATGTKKGGAVVTPAVAPVVATAPAPSRKKARTSGGAADNTSGIRTRSSVRKL